MAPKDVVIRRANAVDAEGVLRAHHDAVETKAASHYTAEQRSGWSRPVTPDTIAEEANHLSDPGLIAYIAEHKGQVIGVSIVAPLNNELRAVYVASGPWRGVGKALLNKVEDDARRRGVTHLTCDSSTNAEAFYAKNGYSVVERTTHTFPKSGISIPCVIMTKWLRP